MLTRARVLPLGLRAARGRMASQAPTRGLSWASAAIEVPHPDKGGRGEDSHVTRPNMMAIADGVGGWAESGVDAGEYSRRLMAGIGHRFDLVPDASPLELLEHSFDAVSSDRILGSTTACVLKLEGNVLHWLNLGDSGFTVYRLAPQGEGGAAYKQVFRSTEQTHYFNCPLQLGGGSELPVHGERGELELQARDLVLAGTDGVFDNLFDAEVEAAIARAVDACGGGGDAAALAQQCAEEVVKAAKAHAVKQSGVTPFAASAKNHGFLYTGGKMDDITVTAAVVTE